MYTLLKYGSFWLKRAIIVLVIVILAFNIPIKEADAAWGFNDLLSIIGDKLGSQKNLPMIIGGDSLMAINQSLPPKMISVVLTAYSSTTDQTKLEDPFTMASGKRVYDGAIAANFLPFGTKVKIPEIFGDKTFIVEDRMNKRFSDRIDIWYPERYLAKQFGVQEANIMILE